MIKHVSTLFLLNDIVYTLSVLSDKCYTLTVLNDEHYAVGNYVKWYSLLSSCFH